MKRLVIGVILFAAAAMFTTSAHAQRLAMHAQDLTGIKICTANAPTVPCSDYVVTRQAGTSEAPIQYTVYFVAVLDTIQVQDSNGGISGTGFGIQYEPYVDNGGVKSGLLLDNWNLCASLSFPQPEWPATNTGMVATWSPCASATSIADNIQAIIGAVRVTSYSAATLYSIRRPANNRTEISPCPNPGQAPPSLDIPDLQRAFVEFSDGSDQGCNPCVTAECFGVPTKPTTWGKIKRSFGDGE